MLVLTTRRDKYRPRVARRDREVIVGLVKPNCFTKKYLLILLLMEIRIRLQRSRRL